MAVEMFHDQVSTKECAGRGDRTRGRLHPRYSPLGMCYFTNTLYYHIMLSKTTFPIVEYPWMYLSAAWGIIYLK